MAVVINVKDDFKSILYFFDRSHSGKDYKNEYVDWVNQIIVISPI